MLQSGNKVLSRLAANGTRHFWRRAPKLGRWLPVAQQNVAPSRWAPASQKAGREGGCQQTSSGEWGLLFGAPFRSLKFACPRSTRMGRLLLTRLPVRCPRRCPGAGRGGRGSAAWLPEAAGRGDGGDPTAAGFATTLLGDLEAKHSRALAAAGFFSGEKSALRNLRPSSSVYSSF